MKQTKQRVPRCSAYNSKTKELSTGCKIPLTKVKATTNSVATELNPEHKTHFVANTITDDNLEEI